jgi:hypothetical protein
VLTRFDGERRLQRGGETERGRVEEAVQRHIKLAVLLGGATFPSSAASAPSVVARVHCVLSVGDFRLLRGAPTAAPSPAPFSSSPFPSLISGGGWIGVFPKAA